MTDRAAIRYVATEKDEAGNTGEAEQRRRSLHEETADAVREMIFRGELPGGSRIPEKALCERFGISRTPLREALKVVAVEGLITLLPNRGARVTPLTPEIVDEVFPVLAQLEALAGRLACARISDEEIAEIRALHYQMALHHTRRERPDYFRLNQAIHEKIVEAAANPTLTVVFRNLSGRVRRARYIANMTNRRWDQAMAEHEAILEAVEGRDGEKLEDLLASHLPNTIEAVKAAIGAELGNKEPD